ncbi:MAG: acyl-CoA dehydrogenase [Comamonadaceae bacterium]|nr:MAG: acyl-CoA dehydrogenase [Comamonadaceae bacterium]
MNFEFTSDQTALLDAVAKVVARHGATPLAPQRRQYSPELAQGLAEAGFFECVRIEELGPVTAVAMVMALAASPLCVELSGAALIAPMLGQDIEGPCAVVQEGRETTAVRFLPVARTLIRLRSTGTDFAHLSSARAQVEAVDSIFAYPMGMLRDPTAIAWEEAGTAAAPALQDLWRVGIAAEIVGSLDAGLKSVLAHVRDRRQFGRPLGSFQAIQHRLAECTTLIEGARWLVLKAADSGRSLDALLAAGQAQRISTRVCYDLHQFMGAMGLTLEHPLHRWTYRAKLLRSELGGADRHFIAAAEAAWGSVACGVQPEKIS